MDRKIMGYARVSSKEQNLDRQILQLKKYVEEENIIVDKASGKNLERPGYQALKGVLGLRQGDTLVITSLDRLSRSKTDIKQELQWFKEHGIRLMIREKGGIKIDALEKLIHKLNDTERDLQYIWEKVTNLNVDILLAELFGKLYAHRTEKELKEDLSKEEIKRFILNVRNMPNLFTRLLFLRNIIDFITQNPIYWKKANIKELNQFLMIRNILYKDLMQEVMKKAIIYRRKALPGKRNKWIDELEKEYPIQRLYLWCISMNIQLYYKTEKDGQEIYLFCGVDDVNSKCMDKKIIQPEGKNKWLDLERRYREENIKFTYIDEGVEECISRDLARKLEKDLVKRDSDRRLKIETQEAYYGIRLEYFKKAFVLQSIKEQMEDKKDNIVNNLMTKIKKDWKISILEKAPEIDSDSIFVDAESEFEKTEYKRKININDFLKQVIESWFVSPYQSIMIERFPERDNKRVYQCLEILMKL